MCNMPKYQKTEARTGMIILGKTFIIDLFVGAGGGYNERDNVEYNERQDESDGEYDEVKNERRIINAFEKFDLGILVRTKEEKVS